MLINNQGKIFGRWNFIDFCVIIFILFGIGMGTMAWWKFTHWKENVLPLTQEQITEKYFQKLQKELDRAKLADEHQRYQRKLKHSPYYDKIFKE